MKAFGKRFLEEYVPAHCKDSTAHEYRRSVTLFIDPWIGSRKVTWIQGSDIAAGPCEIGRRWDDADIA